MKTYKEILGDMMSSFKDEVSIEDLHSGSAVDALLKGIEASMFGGHPPHEQGLRRTLSRLGIKSASELPSLAFGKALQIESLESTLKQATFDTGKLKLWKKP